MLKVTHDSTAYLYLHGVLLHPHQKGTFILSTLQVGKLRLKGVQKPASKVQLRGSNSSHLVVKYFTICNNNMNSGGTGVGGALFVGALGYQERALGLAGD